MKILFLTRYDSKGASSRYRFLQYIPYLETAGFECIVSPLFDNKYLNNLYNCKQNNLLNLFAYIIRRLSILVTTNKFDVLVLEKEVIPFAPAFLERILNMLGIAYVVDYDDAIFHQYDCHTNPIVRTILRKKIAVVMRNARLVIAGNNYIAKYAQQAGAKQVEIIPTVIDISKYSLRESKKNDVFKIVWIGSPSTYQYVEAIMPALAQICGGNSKLLLIGIGNRKINQSWIEVSSWSEASEIKDIQSADVGIMPLPDTAWARGKCGFKLIQYMACGLPVLASPIGVNTEIVEHGKNGFLASNLEDWIRFLTQLRDDKILRTNMGNYGRNKVENNYCLQVTAPRLVELFLL
jgi:glycosyltransferase involved in cell wall biosynthesis